MGHRLDCVDLQKPKVRGPPMRLEQRIMIRPEMSRRAPPMNGGVAHAAEAGCIDRSALHTDSHEAPRDLVHDHAHPVALEHDGRTAPEVHAPQTVCRVSDERQPRGPGSARAGRERFASTRCTTFLSMSTPNVCEMMRVIRGAPESRIARFELDDGADERLARPVGPGFFGRALEENNRRYLPRTSA